MEDRIDVLNWIRAFIGMGVLINKNKFEGGQLLVKGHLLEGGC